MADIDWQNNKYTDLGGKEVDVSQFSKDLSSRCLEEVRQEHQRTDSNRPIESHTATLSTLELGRISGCVENGKAALGQELDHKKADLVLSDLNKKLESIVVNTTAREMVVMAMDHKFSPDFEYTSKTAGDKRVTEALDKAWLRYDYKFTRSIPDGVKNSLPVKPGANERWFLVARW